MKVSLQIRDSQRDPVNAELDVVPISIGQRIGRAAIRLVVCWALAVATISWALVRVTMFIAALAALVFGWPAPL